MTRIPDAVAVASLDTHPLIVTVRADGHADVMSTFAPAEAAAVLRQLAERYEERAAARCATAIATGRPCPVHDARVEDDDQADALTPGTADDVRSALAVTADDPDPARSALRDVLLDTTTPRTPAQAHTAARVLLAAHARQLAALVDSERRALRAQRGLTRSTRGLLTGQSTAAQVIRAYADQLDAEEPTP